MRAQPGAACNSFLVAPEGSIPLLLMGVACTTRDENSCQMLNHIQSKHLSIVLLQHVPS